MILVIGASGLMGRESVKQLLAAGFRVRAGARSLEKIIDLGDLGAEVIQVDLLDPPSLQVACQGVEAVVDAAHALMGSGKNASKFVDGAGKRALIDAAKAAGVRHFVYTSIMGAAPDHPAQFGRLKHSVETYLINSGMDYTILRPSAFMEWHAHNFLGKPLLETGKASILGKGENRTNFISAADVAKYAVVALTNPRACNRILDVGGWDNPTKNEVARMYARAAGITPKISHLPPLALRLMSIVMSVPKPEVADLMRFALWSDTSDQAFHPNRLTEEFPVEITRLPAFIQEKVYEWQSHKS